MTSAEKIIKEALKSNMEWEAYDRLSWSEKLFTFKPKYCESSIILYLTNRLLAEMENVSRAELKFAEARNQAKKCVEIYGNDAIKKLDEMWGK